MKKYIGIIFFMLMHINAFSENPLTDSNYYKVYSNLSIINYAEQAYDLDYKLCKYLSSKERIDKKMAVVDAFNTEAEFEAGELFEIFLLNKYKIEDIKELKNIDDRLILSYLYFTSDIEYSKEIVAKTIGFNTNRLSHSIIKFLIESQQIYNKKCEIWKNFQKLDNTKHTILDFNQDALKVIADSINELKYNCTNVDLVLTKTKRNYDNQKNEDLEKFKLKHKNGVYSINVEINNTLNLDFIFDSGASMVLIPEDVFRVLIRAGTIKKNDFIDMQKFKIADGSIIDKPVIIIKSLKIGDIEVKNIKASVGDLNSDLLLGQSFQKRFKILKIDNISNELIIEK